MSPLGSKPQLLSATASLTQTGAAAAFTVASPEPPPPAELAPPLALGVAVDAPAISPTNMAVAAAHVAMRRDNIIGIPFLHAVWEPDSARCAHTTRAVRPRINMTSKRG